MEAHSLPRSGRRFLPRSPKVLRVLSDERLVEQVRRGNEDAFEALYDRHHRAILAFCRHMLGSADEAEDAVQQTFISAYDAMRSDARELKVKPWLFAIARNRCVSILRARREEPAELEEVALVGLSEQVQLRADLRELVHDIQRLPVDQRGALVLSEVGDMSHAEIGVVLGCEAAKVKALVFQARSSLLETRKARDIPCAEIREQLATATGGALRRGPLRRHLRTCEGCAEFRAEIARQRKALAAILPVVPTVGLKSSLLASIGLGGSGGGGATLGGGAVAAGGGIASLASSGAAVKFATVLAVGGLALGGEIVIDGKSPARPAEAKGGQNGNLQAWPAPAAGAGPGAAAAASRHAVRRHARVRTKPAASKPGAARPARPGGRRSGAPTARHGARQERPRRNARRPHRHGEHVVMTPPATTAPGTGTVTPEPYRPPADAQPQTPDTTGGGDGRRHHGQHRGWTQGRGHGQREQHSGRPHIPRGHHEQPVPPPPRPVDDDAPPAAEDEVPPAGDDGDDGARHGHRGHHHDDSE